MMDTAIKDGRPTFDFMNEGDLADFIKLGHSLDLEVALAGSIGFPHMPALTRLQPDIIGVRGIVCGGDRRSAVKEELVAKVKSALSR
jgi:hypothetical protein